MVNYQFNEHRHRFAVWTAARAVQRNFKVSSFSVRSAIEESCLRSFVEDGNHYSHQNFEVFHVRCASEILAYFQLRQVKNASYGRAAKIIAVYLKTAIVLSGQGTCSKSNVIHPPIDSILLMNLAKAVPELGKLARLRWTTLDKSGYWLLAEQIAERLGLFNWKLEEYWEPARSSKKKQTCR